MEREIKFRSWDKKDAIMYTDFSISARTGKIHGLNNADERFALMQYTGFKDTNDVELYEEDIVTFNGSGYKGIIKFGEFSCGDVYDMTYYITHGYYICSKSIVHTACSLVKDNDVEIIGNIYENCDLL